MTWHSPSLTAWLESLPEGERAEWEQHSRESQLANEARWAEEHRLAAAEAAEQELRAAERRRRGRIADMRSLVRQKREVPHLPTSVSAVITEVIDRCLSFAENGLVIGSPGVGKTRALQEAVRRSDARLGPDVALITVTAVTGSSVKALLEDVCAIVGIAPSAVIADMQRRLFRQVDFAPLLLFDEAQNLSNKAVRELLFVSEQANIPMVFCGNAETLKLVNTKQAAIQQIDRRLPIREEITCILDADVDLIASHFRVEGEAALQLCRRIGSARHADGIAKVLAFARENLAPEDPIRRDHIEAALQLHPHFSRGLNDSGNLTRGRRQSSVRAIGGPDRA